MARDHDALPAYLAARETRPAGWNGRSRTQQDCLRFVIDGVRAQHPRRAPDPMAAVRGRYATRAEAEAIVRDEYGSLRKLVRSMLPGVRPAFAQRGDVGMVQGPDGPTLGMVEAEHVVCLAGPEGATGYVRFPRADLVAAWRAEPEGA